MFKKCAVFTDLHMGGKANSKIHNQDCEDFIKWFISEAKKRNAETCIFMGDWHDCRNTVNVSTLNYTVESLKLLNEAFEQVIMLSGNHDLYYRERRELHSLPMGEFLDKITVISEPTIIDNVSFVPWLVGEEYKEIPNYKSRYMFGHFEIPGFKMNENIEMGDHGTINYSHFKNQEYVFTGHFHIRQHKQNIHYIGNPFAHNYGDAGDENRGCMFLEWGGKPEYVNYTDGPKYVVTNLLELLENQEALLKPKSYIKAKVDSDITYEEANFIRETIMQNYEIRDLKLIPSKITEHKNDSSVDVVFESVDQIVLTELNAIDSSNFDKNILISIYNSLE